MNERHGFIHELQRRNVFRTGAAYLVFAWLLVQVADILLETFQAPSWIMQLLVVVLGIGFVVALVLAWAYEITTHGVERAEVADNSVSKPRFASRQTDFVIIGVLLVALALFSAERFGFVRFGEPASNIRSVAVLPFSFLGPAADSEYFADAMTDELIGRLGRIQGVQIKSRLAVSRYKNTQQPVDTIAEELAVDLVLEGSVRMVENRVRITTQLTDASSGFEEWSDVFDGESDDWFSLHENMAVQIAESLDLHLTPAEHAALTRHYTDNQAAYESFWQGWLLLESFHADVTHPAAKIRAAESHLQDALLLDAGYPLAVAGMAIVNSYYYFYEVDATEERRQQGIELARRALEIDPGLPEGHIALGIAFGTFDRHSEAVASFEKALAFNVDDAVTWCLLAYSCIAQAPPNPAYAEEAARTAIRSDPGWAYSYQMLGWSLALQERYEESVDAYGTGVAFNPNYYFMQFGLGNSLLALENYLEAKSVFEDAITIDETPESLVYLAAAEANLGNIERALELIEQGIEAGFSDFESIRGSPYFQVLSADPRLEGLFEGGPAAD